MEREINDATSPGGPAVKEALSEGNQCIALGLGVGGLGASGALVLGATCPLCLVIAPGLVGAGLLKRRSALRAASLPASEALESPEERSPKDEK
jgi:hypothetical protein